MADLLLPPAPGRSPDWAALEAGLPWLAALRDAPQDPVHHAEGCVLTHTRLVVEALLADPDWQALPEEPRGILYAAALLHDVAKPETMRAEEGGRITHRGHSRKGAVMARRILWHAGWTPACREAVCALVAFHQVPFWLIARTEADQRRLLAEISLVAGLRPLHLLARADARGRACADQDDLLLRTDLFRAAGEEMLGPDAGPYPFSSDHARVRYFRDPERLHPGDAPPDRLDPAFTVSVMSGFPASGKSTAARALGLPVVSLDAWRARLGVDPDEAQGPVVQAAREEARTFLRRREAFVWDATMLSRDVRGLTIPLLLDYGARVRILAVEAAPAEIAARNAARGRDRVPADALARMERRWEFPSPVEAHAIEILETR